MFRDYQNEAINAVLNGRRRVLGFAATGLGKTHIAVGVALRGAFRRILFVAPNREIITQTAELLQTKFECPHPVFIEMNVNRVPKHIRQSKKRGAFVLATIQSLISNDRYKSFSDNFDLIIIDEAHHAHPYNTYAQILQHFTTYDKLLLLTATPCRTDGVGLYHFADEIAFSYSPKWGVEEGWLVPPRVLENLYVERGTEVFEVAAVYNEWKTTLNQSTHILAFVSSVSEIFAAQMYFNRRGVDVVVAHGRQTAYERKEAIERFSRGDAPVMIAHNALTEGFNLPKISGLILSRPTDSPTVFTQIVGRALRPTVDLSAAKTKEERKKLIENSDKPVALIVDLCARKNRKLVSFVQWYDLQPPREQKRKEVEKIIGEKYTSIFEIKNADLDETKIEKISAFIDILDNIVMKTKNGAVFLYKDYYVTLLPTDPYSWRDTPCLVFAKKDDFVVLNLGGWSKKIRAPIRRMLYRPAVYGSNVDPLTEFKRLVHKFSVKTPKNVLTDIPLKLKAGTEMDVAAYIAEKILKYANEVVK